MLKKGVSLLTFQQWEGLYLVQEQKEACMAMSTHSHRPAGPPPQSSMLPSEGVTIGELARLTGFNTKAIRYYESMGILPPSTRSENGYRRYSQADVNRLYLLRRLRLLGISLTEAKALLNATLGALCHDVQDDLLHLVGERLSLLDQEIAELHHLREELLYCQQQLVSHAVDKDEPFTTCYDQACLACASPSEFPHRPVALTPRTERHTRPKEPHPTEIR
jgi:MerR family copper efflux transcriptional regulator